MAKLNFLFKYIQCFHFHLIISILFLVTFTIMFNYNFIQLQFDRSVFPIFNPIIRVFVKK